MHAVKWSTTIRSAAARQASPVIRLSGASRRKSNEIHQSQSIRACRHHADRTHSVELWERKQLVPARPTISDVHQTAGRSAPTMRNVQATVPARTNVALIRVLERVEVTPFVRLSTIEPFARAATALRVIRWCSAIARYHVSIPEFPGKRCRFSNAYLSFSTATTERLTPCTPSPCGPNAECRERNNAGACYCLPNYEGNPYDVFSGCRRECDVNSDCAEKLACVNFKCVDPCPGVCGSQALCDIVNHVPTCVCPEGMIGDPFTRCELRLEEPITRAPPVCDQSTCGPNSICRIQNGVAVCKCQPEMTGTPPNCRPECVQSGDCESQRACVNYKCIDPCPGSCGQNAKCQVINHNPICSCSPDFTGDPFSRCYKEVRTTTPAPPTPCVPSPCGPNAECKVVGSKEACSCLPDYTGSPPNCRPECVLSTECAQNQACIRQKCTDPCPGSCGLNAKCTVVNHTPSCSCEEGYTGDPFTGCQFIQGESNFSHFLWIFF